MVYARFDYETARPLNDFNTTLIQAYYALYYLNKTLARCLRRAGYFYISLRAHVSTSETCGQFRAIKLSLW